MNDHTQTRLAANEAVFRSVNEGIERGRWPGDETELVSFRCECARLGCNALVELTVAEYEQVRARPRRFLMLEGHEVPAVEFVVDHHDRYVVVEKREEAAGVAEETDPRA